MSSDLSPASLSPPAPEAVHLWRFQMPSVSAQAALLALLPASEQARARARSRPQARHQFICARAALRSLLTAYSASPAPQRHAWQFSQGAFGRPALSAAQAALAPRFNVSHSGSWVLLGFASVADPGVDIECLVRDSNALGIARRYFADSEYRALLATPAAERQQLFKQLWTLKEASSKALGGGLASAMRRHVFIPPGSGSVGAQASLPGPGAWRWWQAVDAGSGCCLAVALRQQQRQQGFTCHVRRLYWPWQWQSESLPAVYGV